MKKILISICACFGVINLVIADTMNVNWMVDGSVYDTSTCTVGGDLIIPATTPTKYGYHFVGWGPYSLLEYIESDGTQYINTDYIPLTQNVTYYFSIQATATTYSERHASQMACGRIQFWQSPGGIWRIYEQSPDFSASTSYEVNQKVDVVINNNYDANTFSISINNTSIQTGATARSNTCDTGLVLFAHGRAGSYPFIGRIYYYKIYDNGLLAFNAVPVRRNTDGAIGMFDTVGGTFLQNSGTGVFIPGPTIN